MHLSLLSEVGTLHQVRSERTLARAHRDGLIRGLVFLALVAVPFGLAIATGRGAHLDASAGYAQSFDSATAGAGR